MKYCEHCIILKVYQSRQQESILILVKHGDTLKDLKLAKREYDFMGTYLFEKGFIRHLTRYTVNISSVIIKEYWKIDRK